MPRRRKTARRAYVQPRHRTLRVERLEDRTMLAGDLELLTEINTGWKVGPVGLFAFKSVVYFQADDGTTGLELWKTDGTVAGTGLVKDVMPGLEGAEPNSFLVAGGFVYFMANDGIHGFELWRTDGTEAGTMLVRDIRSGPQSVSARSFTAIGDRLYFVANDGVHGDEVWTTDGTEVGTTLVKDTRIGATGARPRSFAAVNDRLYFTADDGVHGEEVWTTDGTEAGTYLVKDLGPGIYGSQPRSLTNVDGVLFFSANDRLGGYELWKSDGTETGTVRVKDVRSGTGDAFPSLLTNVGGTLFFTANDGVRGIELWRSDGTEAGTTLVRDIRPGARNTSPSSLTNVRGALYFDADDGASGLRRWKSDGTEGGTLPAEEPSPSLDGALQVYNLETPANVEGTLYFRRGSYNWYAPSVIELWKSEGTETSAVPVQTPTGGRVSNPSTLFRLDDRMFVVGHPSWVRSVLFTQVLIDPPALVGNFDRSGGVDAADRNVWVADYGSSMRLHGDGNGDGVVNAADYTVWRDNLTNDDHGDSAADASAIAFPSTTVGRIDYRGDSDWFSFTALAGTAYHFQTLPGGTLADTTLTLIGPDGATQLAINDNATTADRLSLLKWIAPTSGTYFLTARGVGSTTGTYSVFFSDEHGDSADLATPVAISSTANGRIDFSGDSDWFSFAAMAGSHYRFQTLRAGTVDDTTLTLLGPDGVTPLAVSDSSRSLDGVSLITWSAPSSGTYFLTVRGAGSRGGTYALLVTDDHANSSMGATPVSDFSTTHGAIGAAGDSDWFSFTAIAGALYRLQTLPGGTLADTTLAVVGPDGATQLAFNDDWPGRLSLIIWSAPTNGIYYVAVRGTSANTGTYSLAVVRLTPALAMSDGESEQADNHGTDALTSLDEAFAALSVQPVFQPTIPTAPRSRFAPGVRAPR
jgi:ELWxxDGT repeat protein